MRAVFEIGINDSAVSQTSSPRAHWWCSPFLEGTNLAS